MSMISSRCDELRETADELDERAKLYAPTGRNVLSPMLRSAADTIWELRCKLAGVVDQSDEIERLKDENAKLIVKLNAEHIARQNVEVENAKLRELIADVHEALRADKAGMFHKLILASMEDDMQKLGIEEEPHD